MPVLIALAGERRSGKGTAAEVISKIAGDLGLSFRERQLSGPGKHHLATIFRPGISEEEAIRWFEALKKTDTKVRIVTNAGPVQATVSELSLAEFMQHGLQEASRDLWGSGFWLDKILPIEDESGRYGSAYHPAFEVDGKVADVCVISDLRQPNEAERVRDFGGFVYETKRPKNNDPYRRSKGGGHITERPLPRELVNGTIVNDGTLEQMQEKAAKVFLPILKRFG